jgi:hypothetical protein
MDKRKKSPDREKNRKQRKQLSALTRSATKRKPDIRGSGKKENAPQRKIHKTDGGFSSLK